MSTPIWFQYTCMAAGHVSGYPGYVHCTRVLALSIKVFLEKEKNKVIIQLLIKSSYWGKIEWEWNLINRHYMYVIKQTMFFIFVSHCRSQSSCVFVESLCHLQTSLGNVSVVCCFVKLLSSGLCSMWKKWRWTLNYISMAEILLCRHFMARVSFFVFSFLFIVVNEFFSRPLFLLIVSITKFSIVIGSTRAYLSRNRRAITWVSDYRCLIWTFSNRTPVIGYPITRALMASSAMFSAVFKT